MKKRLMLLALTLLLVMTFSQAALAAGAGNKGVCPNRDSGLNFKRVPIAEKLNLSDRQVQQLKAINLSTYQSTRALKIKLLDAGFELRQLMITGTDKTAINSKIKDINALQSQIHQARQQKWQKVQKILTPEQQAKLKAVKGSGQPGGWCKGGCCQPK